MEYKARFVVFQGNVIGDRNFTTSVSLLSSCSWIDVSTRHKHLFSGTNEVQSVIKKHAFTLD